MHLPTFMGYFIVILALFTVILINELGHLVFGLLCGAAIKSFNVGFGRTFFQFSIRDIEIRFRIFLVLGGFVQFKSEEECLENELFIGNLTYFKKILVNLGGIIFNFVSAFVTLVIMSMLIGLEFIPALQTAITLCATVIGLSLASMNKIGDFSSPIGIVSQGGLMIQSLPTKGIMSMITNYFLMCTMLHLGVGFSNLIPLSILDGGQCVVDTIKALFDKTSKARKFLAAYELISMFSLGILVIFLFSKDSIELFKLIFKT